MTTGRRSAIALTARDGQALGWAGEQYAIRFDTLTVLLTRLSPEPGRRPMLLSRRSVRDVVRRWEGAGLARVESALGSIWVTPTVRGLRFGGLDYDPWPLTGTRLRHVHSVAVCRLALEELGWAWQGERSLRAERQAERERLGRERRELWPRWSVPDGVVSQRELRREVEVELTQKSDRLLADALRVRTRTQAVVGYFTPPELRDRITAQVARVLAELRAGGKVSRAPVTVDVDVLPVVPGVSYDGRW